MTKIVLDPTAHQTERHANSQLDLTRRLAWRLQWEKAQVDNWQTSSQAGGQRADSAEASVAEGGGGLKEKNETFTRNPLGPDKIPAVTVSRRPDQSDKNPSTRSYDSSSTRELRSSKGHTAMVPAGVERAGRPMLINQKSLQTVRTMPMPLNRPPLPAGVHIYQADGKVEVALRNTGLNGKDGLTLMNELKKDLASLGLRLARLTINGELLWQTQTYASNGLAFSDTDGDEAPIDKIY